MAAANRRREAELLMYGAGARPMGYGGAYPGVYPPAAVTEVYVQVG